MDKYIVAWDSESKCFAIYWLQNDWNAPYYTYYTGCFDSPVEAYKRIEQLM